MKLPLLDEIFSSIIHGLGFLAAVVGLVLFFTYRFETSNVWRIIGFSIFGFSLICMYLFSTLSHSLAFTKARKIFAILDHSSIFLLIAGTYTYFLLTVLRSTSGWSLLSIIWVLCIAGIILKAFFVDRLRLLSVVLYLFLGWLCVIVIVPMWHVVHVQIFFLLLVGGLFYSAGTIFYGLQKMPFSHSIWHIFVVVATVCHFLAIYSL